MGLLDGSTGLVLAVTPTHLLVSHVGDTRAVLYDSGHVVALSSDHKPSSKDETRRIEGLGGQVTTLGVPRVNGVFAGMCYVCLVCYVCMFVMYVCMHFFSWLFVCVFGQARLFPHSYVFASCFMLSEISTRCLT